MLHITNGDCAAEVFVRAGIGGENIIAWRDVLHEGPVPGGMPLEMLSSVRARFICDSGFGDYDAIREQFSERDFRVAGGQGEDEVVLWFESDLYDQLQLLQVLDWFADPTHRPMRLTRVYTDRVPGTERFEALGAIAPERVRELLDARVPVSEDELRVAVEAWAAFRDCDPRALAASRHDPRMRALPYLRDAIGRLLEELPDTACGLSRTEANAARLLAEQPRTREALFRQVQDLEPRPFLGDTWFWRMLDRLAEGETPLLKRRASAADPAFGRGDLWSLTAEGEAVLDGRVDGVDLARVDRWLGGTRLLHRDSVWRWDGASLSRDGRVS